MVGAYNAHLFTLMDNNIAHFFAVLLYTSSTFMWIPWSTLIDWSVLRCIITVIKYITKLSIFADCMVQSVPAYKVCVDQENYSSLGAILSLSIDEIVV